MKLARLLWEEGMAQSVSDASRLIKQGAVYAGFGTTWVKVTNPAEDSPDDDVRRFKVGDGSWRCVPRIKPEPDESYFVQLRGIC